MRTWPFENRYELNPFAELSRLQREMNRLFDGYSAGGRAFPPVNLLSNAQEAVVTAEIPGIKPEELDITVNENLLTLEGRRKPEESGDDVTYHRTERDFGRFYRQVRLPFDVENDRVSARYTDGVVRITLPRSEKSKPKKIQVSQN